MVKNLTPYPTYKPSGVEWLGEVPEHWEVRRLKGACRLSYGDSLPDESRVNGAIAVYGSNGPVGTHSSANTLAPCIVVGRKGSFGKVHYSTSPVFAIDTTYYVDEAVSSNNLAWLARVLDWARLDEVSRDSAVPGLSREDAYHRQLPIPPLAEQASIVRYLDYVDRRVRRYVAAKRKLIALLEEERQAVIHQAVTRGLYPNVPLKPSGVEWLGDIPAHWEVRRIKSLSQVKRGASPRPIDDQRYFDDGGEFAWVRIVDVSASGHYLEETSQRLSELGQSLSVQLQPDSLFLSIAGSVGKPIIAKIKCCIHDGFVYFPEFRGNVEFLYQVFSCSSPFSGLGKLGTQLNLNTDTVGRICLGWPPESEQSAIVEFIEKVTGRLDNDISRALRQIELLEEYRTRLIADVVTGKLDVRAAAADLADEEEPVDGDGLMTDNDAIDYDFHGVSQSEE